MQFHCQLLGRECCSLAIEILCHMGSTSTSSPKRRFRLPKRGTRAAKRRETTARLLLRRSLGVALLLALGWIGWLTLQINEVAEKDVYKRQAQDICLDSSQPWRRRPESGSRMC